MKLQRMIRRNSLLLVAGALAFCGARAAAQTQGESANAAQVSAVPARITQAIDETQLVTLKGNVHPLARPEFDQGAVADSQPLNRMLLVLKRSDEQEAALRQLLDDQQTRGSANYHVWLTPEQFGKQFGPADADILTLTDWLTAQGFTGIKVGPGRGLVEFSGNAGQIRRTFHTEIHSYNVNGETHMANASEPQIPAALSPVVAGVKSLHNFRRESHLRKLGDFVKDMNTGELRPLFTASGGAFQAVGPADFAKIYNIPTGTLDGTGQTIAIVARSNINVQDVKDYRTVFGLPQNFTSANVVLNGPDPGITVDETEADLDVEMSGGVAPGATIKFVVTESTESDLSDGADLSAIYIIENNLAGVMSMSFGSCEALDNLTDAQTISQTWEQGAAQGITIVLSTGDSGSAGCDQNNPAGIAQNGVSVSILASTAFNVAVGGTDFDYSAHPPSTYWNATNTNPGEVSAMGYIPEIPWNSSCAAAGSLTGCASPHPINPNGFDILAAGGGESIFNPEPSWQSNAITGLTSDGHRHMPDVSLFAAVNSNSNNFIIICEADSPTQNGNTCNLSSNPLEFSGVGGTSAAAPAFAGIVALLNQKVGARVGNINYGLYSLAKSETFASCNSTTGPASTCVFNDVTKGNIAVACQGTSLNCSNNVSASAVGVTTTTLGGTTLAYGATAGYDLATGLGSINVTNLTSQWINVGLKSSTTTITQSPSGTLNHNTSQTFKVSVTGTGGTPTQDVSLIAKPVGLPEVSLGDATLSAGAATITTALLPGGTSYPVVAHYSGDGTFAGSDSTAVNVTVNKENSLVTPTLLLCGANSCATPSTTVVYGSAYILRVDVTNAAGTQCNPGATPCATGNVTLTDNGGTLDFGTATLNNLGYLEDQPIQLSGGANAIAAAYAGDSSYNANTGNLAVTVTTAATQAALGASPTTNVTTATPVTLTATVVAPASNGAGPTGTVSFTSNGTAIPGTPSISTVGFNQITDAPPMLTATLTTTLTAGSKSIVATYGGDINYAGSGPSNAVAITVTGAANSGTFTVSGTAVTVTAGSSNTSTIKVTPSGSFTTAQPVMITCPASANVPAGVTCTPLTITIPTGTNPAAISMPLTVSVLAPSSSLSASAAPTEQTLYAAGLVPASGGKGWWTLSAGTGLAAMLLLIRPGRKRYRTALGLGLLCVLSFTLGCGGGYGGGGGGPVVTTTKISVVSTKVPSGTNVAFSITVTASVGANGQVQLFDGGTALGTPASVTNGSTTIMNALPVGTHSISAHYLGDAQTQASQSGTLNVAVTGGPVAAAITTSPVATPAAPPINITIN
jgi:hypothetical protein